MRIWGPISDCRVTLLANCGCSIGGEQAEVDSFDFATDYAQCLGNTKHLQSCDFVFIGKNKHSSIDLLVLREL